MLAGAGSLTADTIGGMRICNVAIDCDYQFFIEMGQDETAALNYVATLIAARVLQGIASSLLWLAVYFKSQLEVTLERVLGIPVPQYM